MGFDMVQFFTLWRSKALKNERTFSLSESLCGAFCIIIEIFCLAENLRSKA